MLTRGAVTLLEPGVPGLHTLEVGCLKARLGHLGQRLLQLINEHSRLVGIAERRDADNAIRITDANRFDMEELDLVPMIDLRRAIQDVVMPLEVEALGGVDPCKPDPPELIGVTDDAHHLRHLPQLDHDGLGVCGHPACLTLLVLDLVPLAVLEQDGELLTPLQGSNELPTRTGL